jgi:hypothetical protein
VEITGDIFDADGNAVGGVMLFHHGPSMRSTESGSGCST